MATWQQLSADSRQAAQVLLDSKHLRSSICRSYYAAYSAITGELSGKVTFATGRNNPRHAELVNYIRNNLPSLSETSRRKLSKAIRILWKARVEADYTPSASIDGSVARDMLRQACVLLRELEVER